GDAETNVAAKKSICLTQTGNDLTAGDSQKFMFGQVDQSFVIKGKVNTQIVCPDSERSKVIAHDGVHLSFQSMSQRAVNSSMDAMIQSAAQKSSAFAAKTPNAELSIGQDQKYHLDLTASPAGAYYVDLPDAAMTESDKLHITKNSNQSVILTNRSSGTVNLQKFNLNGVGTDTLTKASGYEESKNIYLNFPNAKTINLNGSVIGNLLAANASVYVYGTGAGHIVSDKVIIESGEWHNIDQVDRGEEHHPEVTGVTVKKVWDDRNNQDGKRPKSVKVKLLVDGKNADSENAFVSLSEDNKWTYSWNNLPVKKDGKEITYTVKEENVPEGYEASVTEDSQRNFTVVNRYTPEMVSISGKKIWKDQDNQDKTRPSSITVRLFADGKEAAHRTVTEENGWKYSFSDVPKYQSGKEITYTVSEDAVSGYETKIDGYTITNTLTPKKGDDKNTPKDPSDQSDQDGKKENSKQPGDSQNHGKSSTSKNSPDTGDSASVGIWIALLLAGAAGITGVTYERIKK
ncbi:MAG: Cna B-type domain-containing protein, partial [Eubacteriales bacterium]|nr:Cna B-type domain-containing protein [Eubacteriales bacterium]